MKIDYSTKIGVLSRILSCSLIIWYPLIFKNLSHKPNVTADVLGINDYLKNFINWDSEWYLEIALAPSSIKCKGNNCINSFFKDLYKLDQEKAFFPIFPLIIRVVHKFLRNILHIYNNNILILLIIIINNALFVFSCRDFEFILRFLKRQRFHVSNSTKYINLDMKLQNQDFITENIWRNKNKTNKNTTNLDNDNQNNKKKKENDIKSERFIKTCIILYAFNPASIFFSVLYTESLFAFLGIKILILWIRSEFMINTIIKRSEENYYGFYYCNKQVKQPHKKKTFIQSFVDENDFLENETVKTLFDKSLTQKFFCDFIHYIYINIKMVIVMCFIVLTRLNGIYLCGLGMYSCVFTTAKILKTKSIGYKKLFALLNATLCVISILIPLFILTHYLNIIIDVSGKDILVMQFLNSLSMYSEIQNKFWDVGLFKYWKLSNILRFLLALPPTVVVFSLFSRIFLSIFKDLNYYCINISDGEKPETHFSAIRKLFKKLTSYNYLQFQIEFVFSVHLLALTLTVVITANVEIINRVAFSSNPYIYVALMKMFGIFSDCAKWKRNIFLGCSIFYYYWGIVLFSLNYPWT